MLIIFWFIIMIFVSIYAWSKWTGNTDTSTDEIANITIPNLIPPEIIIKYPHFDTDKIIEYTGTEKVNKPLFRPQNLRQYIGQQQAKNTIIMAVEMINQLRPVNLLISGRAGCGKTTILYILKNMLNAHLIYRISNQLSEPNQIIEMVNEINTTEQLTLLFIDEIHSIKPKLAECFYEVLEDFTIAGKKIKPFVFVGATTNKDELVKKMTPLLDRMQIHITLVDYINEEIKIIIKQYKDQLYPERSIAEENYDIIAENAKNTPRIAISLLLKNLVEPNIFKVLHSSDIIKEGLTSIDFKILGNLLASAKPIGAEALAQSVKINKQDYLMLYEPYLVGQGYVIRSTRGRTIGEEGKKLIQGE